MGLSLLMVQAQVVKKHKTMCTLAYLTPLLYAMHGNSFHYVSIEVIWSNMLKMMKNVNKYVR